jgi:tetratricopeptide (TPR) repeat protein
LAIRVKAFRPDHPDIGLSLRNVGNVYAKEGRCADAEPLYKQSLQIFEKVFGPDHPYVPLVLDDLAACYSKQRNYAEVEGLLKKALAIREKTRGPDHPDVELTLRNLAALYREQGRTAEAQPLYRRAAAIREKLQRDRSQTAQAPQDSIPKPAAPARRLGVIHLLPGGSLFTRSSGRRRAA